jgi:O-antigen/teichoic acid export membrane protein
MSVGSRLGRTTIAAQPESTPDRETSGALLSQSVVLYVATILAILFKFLGGFLVAGLLGPVLFGLRNIFGLITEYQQFSHAGTFDAMRREIPYHRGRGDAAHIDVIASNVVGANLVYAVSAALGMSLVALYLHSGGYPTIYVDFAVFLAGFIVLEKLRLFCDARLLADMRSDLLARARLLHQFLVATLTVVLVFYMGLRGLFIGLFAAELLTVAYLLPLIGRIPTPSCRLAVLWRLVKIGFPIMLITLAFILLRSVDRVIIAARLSPEMLGYFGIATIISGLIYFALADVLGAILFPRVMESLGSNEQASGLKDYVIQPTLLIAFLVPFLIGAMYLSIHVPLLHLLPDYAPAIPVSKILILGSFCFCVPLAALLVCVALNLQMQVVLFTIASVILNGFFSYSLISLGFGINGVAFGTVAAYFIFSGIIVTFALRQLGLSTAVSLRFLTLIYIPLLYAVVLLLLVDAAPAFEAAGLWTDVLVTSAKIALFCAVYALVLIPLRKQPAFSVLAGHLTRRRKAPTS